MKTRPRKCAACRNPFSPRNSLQKACSPECAMDIAKKQREKAERIADAADRKVIRQKLEDLKPLSYFAEKAQRAVNALVRERDKSEPCISCGRHHNGKWNAGHYISRGRSPALRFDLDNIHKQCEPCNTSLSGNLIEYRKALIRKIGLARVERLEQEHPLPHWRRADYERIESEAKAEQSRGS